MASKPPAPRPPPTSTASVRRNLFHHSLSRRPTGGSSKSSAASTAAAVGEEPAIHDEQGDIVVRDRNGNYQVTVPTLPPMDEEQAAEEEEGLEREKMETRLLEVLRNKSLQAGGEPPVPELLQAVQSSLRRKVASLDDDNWIFEAEQGMTDG